MHVSTRHGPDGVELLGRDAGPDRLGRAPAALTAPAVGRGDGLRTGAGEGGRRRRAGRQAGPDHPPVVAGWLVLSGQEVLFYYGHRLCHAWPPLYRAVHKIHHEVGGQAGRQQARPRVARASAPPPGSRRLRRSAGQTAQAGRQAGRRRVLSCPACLPPVAGSCRPLWARRPCTATGWSTHWSTCCPWGPGPRSW